MISDSQLFYSFVSDHPESATRHDRPAFRRPDGAIATVARLFNGMEYNRLGILVMNRGEQGICLRSPIGLVPGAIYRLSLGTSFADSTVIQITASRRREDDAYDVGALEVANVEHAAAAA